VQATLRHFSNSSADRVFVCRVPAVVLAPPYRGLCTEMSYSCGSADLVHSSNTAVFTFMWVAGHGASPPTPDDINTHTTPWPLWHRHWKFLQVL